MEKENTTTTIEQQINAINGEVQSYVRSMTWHNHQKALDDAITTLNSYEALKAENERLKDRERELAAALHGQMDVTDELGKALYNQTGMSQIIENNEKLRADRAELLEALKKIDYWCDCHTPHTALPPVNIKSILSKFNPNETK